MSKQHWVVIDAIKQEMRCNHCGETESTSILAGKRLGYAADIMRAFVKAHKDCRKEEVA